MYLKDEGIELRRYKMKDILFKTDEYVFSYRVAGVCVRDGCVLLQNTTSDPAYAFPGGHVTFGETNEETLVREFREEIGADIKVGELRWVAEVFFPWGEIPCHQICLYYDIDIVSDNIPREGSFIAKEQLEGRDFDIMFHWVPLDLVKDIELYPPECKELLSKPDTGTVHFVYKE